MGLELVRHHSFETYSIEKVYLLQKRCGSAINSLDGGLVAPFSVLTHLN